MNETTERLLNAYNKVLERIHHTIEDDNNTIKDAIIRAQEKALELKELTHEEVDKMSDCLLKDAEDAAEYLVTTEEELSGWLRFDLQLLETKMLTWLSDVADKTTVELNQLNVIAKASKK
ncbi:MAG: hypothetical protein HN790_05835 [Methylococcales bacterium]|nr:hypothetical protein [Methylococcales bacterium]